MAAPSSAALAQAGSATDKLRLHETPTFRLMPVLSPALPVWNRMVANWMAA